MKRHALQQLAADLKQNDVDCAMITETWFTKKHSDEHVSIDGYKLFRCDRHLRKGGGVCIYVRKNIDCRVINLCNASKRFEKMWLILYLNQTFMCQFVTSTCSVLQTK